MKSLIDEEYVRGDLAQLMIGTAKNELIISSDEILLLKIDGDAIINKYLLHENRDDFPYSNIPMHQEKGTELYNILFEMNRNYLIYELDTNNIFNNQFTRIDKGVLWDCEGPSLDKQKREQIMNHDEVRQIFDCFNYDSFYIINTRGIIEFAYNIKDGIRVGRYVLPTEREIRGYINDKKKLTIYGGFFGGMNNVLITSKDGNFKACKFSLSVDKDENYKMITQDIILPVILPDLSKIEEYESIGKVSL